MMSRALKKIGAIINSIMHPMGLHVSRYSADLSSKAELGGMLVRLAKRQIDVRTVIDIGASDGSWSTKMESVYPKANYLLVEANEVHRQALENYVSVRGNAEFVLAVAGDEPGLIFFDDNDPMGGLASHQPLGNSKKSFPCTTVDAEAERRNLEGPFLLKLDTHGFEVPILEGAAQVLKSTNLLVIEVYNFNLTGETLRFWEMCEYLEKLGFRPIDMLDPMFRPKDGVFWQFDIVFARSSRDEFLSNTYL